MQKLDLSWNIAHVLEKLSSQKIVEIFELGFVKPTASFGYLQIKPILFTSKSEYDELLKSETYASILNCLDVSDIFEPQNLSELSRLLEGNIGRDLLSSPKISRFYIFHKSLIQLKKISDELLIKNELKGELESLLDSGLIIFQIAIDENGLDTNQYLKIFTALNELIETVEKILYGKQEEIAPPKIILLDSGSDTNLGIKSRVETAKSIFLIFKEVWDYVANYKFYKAKQKNEALMESLTIRKKIKEMEEDNVIDSDEALQYLHTIKTRTDSLIGLKVLPKSLMNTNQNVSSKNILENYKDQKFLD